MVTLTSAHLSNKINKICLLLLYILYFIEDQKDSPAELAFKYAIYKINRDQEVKVLKVMLSYFYICYHLFVLSIKTKIYYPLN